MHGNFILFVIPKSMIYITLLLHLLHVLIKNAIQILCWLQNKMAETKYGLAKKVYYLRYVIVA